MSAVNEETPDGVQKHDQSPAKETTMTENTIPCPIWCKHDGTMTAHAIEREASGFPMCYHESIDLLQANHPGTHIVAVSVRRLDTFTVNGIEVGQPEVHLYPDTLDGNADMTAEQTRALATALSQAAGYLDGSETGHVIRELLTTDAAAADDAERLEVPC